MVIAIYIRVSTDEQADEGYSLAEQERQCRAYCASRGWDDVRIYRDAGLSAFKDRIQDRPDLARLLQDVRDGKIRAVVVHKLDRFFRRAKLLIATVEELIDQRGVTFVSVAEQIDFSTPAGRVMLANLGAFAEYYSRNLSLETKKGLAGKARAGDWIGPVPFGYTRDGKTLTPSADADIVRRIFTMYATGEHSYTTIAHDLNRDGVRLTHWRDGAKRFGRESIRSILGNDAYVGMVQCKGVRAIGRHEPLIGDGLWNACVAIRQRRERTHNTPSLRGAGGVLSEFVYCARCGARMWAHRSGRTGTHYYRCAHRREYGDQVCDAPMLRQSVADERVCDALRRLGTVSASFRARVIARAEELLRAEAPTPAIDAAAVRRQLSRLRAAFLDGDVELTEAVYFAERKRLESLLETTPPPPPRVLDLDLAMDALASLTSVLDKPPSERRAIIQQFITAVWLDKHVGVARWEVVAHYGVLVDAVCGGCPTGDEAPFPTAILPQRVYATP